MSKYQMQKIRSSLEVDLTSSGDEAFPNGAGQGRGIVGIKGIWEEAMTSDHLPVSLTSICGLTRLYGPHIHNSSMLREYGSEIQ